jgi:hypothetical protein
MEATCSNETLATTYRITWRHDPEDDTLDMNLDLVFYQLLVGDILKSNGMQDTSNFSGLISIHFYAHAQHCGASIKIALSVRLSGRTNETTQKRINRF